MRILNRLIVIFTFGLFLLVIIAYARGYRFDINERSIRPTGIIAINSFPQAARVYVNGSLKGATSINLTLPPGTYTVEIKKDGYTAVKKTVNLKGELVQSVDALLFPINPSLSPLTNLGIVRAVQVDQTDRILLFSDNSDPEKDGIYIFNSANKPLSFLPPLTPLALKSSFPQGVDFSSAKVYYSFDYKQAIIELPIPTGPETVTPPVSYLIDLDSANQQPFDVTTSRETLFAAWQEEKQQETQKILEALPRAIRRVASDSFHIVSVSPDETKLMYQAKANLKLPLVIDPPLVAANQTPEERDLKKDTVYIYDKKEDKNFRIPFSTPKSQVFENQLLATLIFPLWYSDSKHFVIKEENNTSVVDYDGTNKQSVYSGPQEEGFLAINSGGRLLILANLNPRANKFPDLYSVGIR